MTRILLVDDEPDLLEAWSFALEHVGYEVERANGAQEALRALQRRLPDLVITDLMMPGMSGEELSRALRQHPEWMHIPIVLHTSAHVDAPADKAPWNAVLRKPARMDDFLATVARLAEGG
ncbi:response regulator [Caballeronia sp. LZ065]|uniref:response regulator n=1 Tax=Caballeronia sp. LZ065 TaxID=3038571 RepID=UPI002855FDF3|nr:response regulator [Caballeronia sp. LZ065]MDR5782968.1 response regulator [Caballeronia sp. LZ065]